MTQQAHHLFDVTSYYRTFMEHYKVKGAWKFYFLDNKIQLNAPLTVCAAGNLKFQLFIKKLTLNELNRNVLKSKVARSSFVRRKILL
jgi:hypothetical protein